MRKFFLAVAVALILFMHLFRITEIPYGFNVDEMGAAYDAYTISEYGVDRYLNSYPVYFINFGDGQNALYTYCVAIFFHFFGVSKWMVRIPMVISSLIGACFGYRLILNKWKNEGLGVLFLFLYGMMPAITMMQRFGLESHLMLSLTAPVLYSVCRAAEKGTRKSYFMSGVICGLMLYTYALSYPVLLVMLVGTLAYLLYIKKISFSQGIAFTLPFVCLAIPICMVQIVNMWGLPSVHLGAITVPRLINYRFAEVETGFRISRLGNILKNTLFFDDLSYNTIPYFGTVFYVSIPFLIVGMAKAFSCLYRCIRGREWDAYIPITLWFFGEILMGCMISSEQNTTRMNGIFLVYLVFIVNGIYTIFAHIRANILKRSFVIVVTVLYSISFLAFSGFYFTRYNEWAFPMKWLFFESYDEIKPVVEEAKIQNKPVDYPWPYVYYLYTFRVNPFEINIPENGIDTFGEDEINGYPEQVNPEENYVVYRTDKSSLELLETLGYSIEKTENFSFCVTPMINREKKAEEGITMLLDYITEKDGKMVIHGWCVDEAENTVFQQILVEKEGKIVGESAALQNDGVSELYHKPEYAFAAFHLELPKDLLVDGKEIRFMGKNALGSAKLIYRILEEEK